jgi:hypothetical protein
MKQTRCDSSKTRSPLKDHTLENLTTPRRIAHFSDPVAIFCHGAAKGLFSNVNDGRRNASHRQRGTTSKREAANSSELGWIFKCDLHKASTAPETAVPEEFKRTRERDRVDVGTRAESHLLDTRQLSIPLEDDRLQMPIWTKPGPVDGFDG